MEELSNFGLLEMTRQRLREGSIRWETQLSLGSFSQKNFKEDTASCFYRQSKNNKNLCSRKGQNFHRKKFTRGAQIFSKKIPF